MESAIGPDAGCGHAAGAAPYRGVCRGVETGEATTAAAPAAITLDDITCQLG